MTSTSDHGDRDLLEFADAVTKGYGPQPQSDLEHTYLHVQRTMKASISPIPTMVKQDAWEEIMNTSEATSSRTRHLPPRTRVRARRLGWSSFASVAAAFLVVLAGVGVWRGWSYDNVPPTQETRQVAGLAPTTLNAIQADSTPETAVAARTTTSVPIFQVVDEQPMDGPVIWLTSTGTLNYDDGTGNVTVIAEDVTQVNSTTTNVITYFVDDPAKDTENRDGSTSKGYTQTYFNLATGQTLVDDGTSSSYLGGPNTFGSLQVLTVEGSSHEWSIVNFETMQYRSISELTGGQFRSSDSLTVAISDDMSTIVISPSQYQSEASALLNRQSGLPGELAVMPADLSSVSWVTIPEGMPAVGNFELSPDGSKIALISQDRERLDSSVPFTTVVSIVDVATNTELTRTNDVQTNGSVHVQWKGDSQALLVVTDKSVQSYAVDGSDPTTLFESEGTVWLMPRIVGHPEIVHLLVSSEELMTSGSTPSTTQFVILDAETGETITIDGEPWFLSSSYPVTYAAQLAPIPVMQSDDSYDAVLVHPLTGEIIPDVVADTYNRLDDPSFPLEPGKTYHSTMQAVTTAPSAPISAVKLSDGTLAIVTVTETSQAIRIVPMPENAIEHQLLFSSNGGFLTSGANWETLDTGTYYMLDLSDENSEWIAGPADSRVEFVTLQHE